MNVELINIGNELLLGLVTNTHASYLGRELPGLGFEIERQVCVGDDPEAIAGALRDAFGRADVVMTTGGLGPTSDDRTAATVAAMLGMKFRVDPKVEADNQRYFKRRGVPMPEAVRGQAKVPEAALVLHNAFGTAPGFIAPLPSSASSRARWLIVLPGPPRELKPMFETGVAAFLRREFPSSPLHVRIVRACDLGESVLQEKVEAKLRARFPSLGIGYCARPGEVDLRLISRVSQREADEAGELARSILGSAVFGDGSQEIEEIVIGLLREKGKTAACAESCTGGALANRFTNVAGSSEAFLQGWVTYSDRSKVKELGVRPETLAAHGAVSEPVVLEMASGALKNSGADYALAVTGIAGPGGGTADKPVGTVFIGLASAGGVKAWKEFFPLDRWTFKWRVAQRALNLLRLEIGSQR